MSTAQKVRLWFMLAALVIIVIGEACIGSQDGAGGGDGAIVLSMTSWDAIQGWSFMGLISAIALAVLGPITLWRFLRPKPQAPAVQPYPPAAPGASAYGQYPTPQYPTPQYPTPQYPTPQYPQQAPQVPHQTPGGYPPPTS